MSSTQHRCVFVGNIPYDASEEELIRICEEVGPVVSFRLVLDRDTGKPKGYGFCEYRDEETALSARRNLQGYDINGRQLRVDFAENEKGSGDRNREQVKGRGGPGLVDALKQTGGPKVVRDTSLYQPVGLPAAVSAAAVMASLLGAPQLPAGSIAPMGVVRPPMGIDALTIHLASMSKHQLYEVLHHMKNFVQQNQQQARQVLTLNPQLVKALFQAQIILGWVPQVPLQTLQTQGLQQPSGMPLQQGQAQQAPSNTQLQQGLQQAQTHRPQSFPFPLPAHLQQQGGARTGPMLIPPQPLPPPPSSSLSLPPLNLAMQQRPQPQLPLPLNPPPLPNQVRPSLPPSPPQGAQAAGFQHTFSQSTNLPQIQQSSGAPPNMPYLGVPPPLPNQPPPHLLQVPRTIGDMSGNGSIGQGGLPGNVGLLIPTSGGMTQYGRAVGAEIPASSAPYANWNPVPASSGSIVGAPLATTSTLVMSMPMGSNMVGSNNQQGVLRGPPFEGPAMLHSQEYSQTAMQLPSQQQQLPSQQQQLPSQQQPQVSLEPEQQKALLQQVMNLTPEQINSLPPEQRQQVLDLQQAFRNQII